MLFKEHKNLCYDCQSVATVNCIGPNGYMYTAVLEYVKALLATGNYEMVACNHPINEVNDKDGC